MAFSNILFPVDFSEACIALKTEVVWMARKFNSTVTLLHVFEIPNAWYGMSEVCAMSMEWISTMMGEARKKLDAFDLDLPADKLKRVSLDGQAALEICAWLREHPVDLLAMAAHGHGAMEGLMLGSVTAKVLHNALVPVWLHPAKGAASGAGGVFKIVCGIDLDDEAVPLLRYAKEMGQAFGATVTLVHSLPVRRNKYFNSELLRVLTGMASEEIASAQARAGTNFAVKVTGLPVGHSLAEIAEQENANLILIGRGHSQEFLGRFRTHTYNLLNQATCPVVSFCQPRADATVSNGETLGAVC